MTIFYNYLPYRNLKKEKKGGGHISTLLAILKKVFLPKTECVKRHTSRARQHHSPEIFSSQKKKKHPCACPIILLDTQIPRRAIQHPQKQKTINK